MTSNIHDLIDQIQGQLPGRWRVPGRDFYERETTAVTKDILGCLLVRQIASPSQSAPLTLGGRIVEAEAYLGEHDPAAHASRGRTLATDVMYRAGGHAYVYKIYGMYYCLNATAEPPGTPGCVLIRAIEPLFGIDAMLARRGLEAEKIRNLGSGPGKLCQALGIDRGLNGADLTRRAAPDPAAGGKAKRDRLQRPARRHHQGGRLAAAFLDCGFALGISGTKSMTTSSGGQLTRSAGTPE